MRIGYDISQTGQGKAGCGHYTAALLQALLDQDKGNDYLLYPHFTPAVWDDTVLDRHAADSQRVRVHSLAPGRPEMYNFWRAGPEAVHKGLGRPEVIHANSYFCPPPVPDCKIIYTLYDLSFVDHPEWTTPENWWNCLSGVMDAAFFADQIVSISAHSRRRFLDFFPFFPEERVHVAHPASRLTMPEEAASPPTTRFDLLSGAFWLGVGTLEPRKNHARLLRAYASLLEHGTAQYPLVLAGGRGWLTQELEQELNRPELAGKVRMLGYVSDQELTWLYRHCLGFVYPSLDEGFGMPVLEAMSLGAAVITSNVAALPEVAGDAALLVDPLNEEQLAQAMLRLAADPDLRQELGQKAGNQARKFSWDSTAQCVLQAYSAAMSMEKRTAPVSHHHLLQWWSACSPHLRDRMQAFFDFWRQSEADREARLNVIEDLQSRLKVLEGRRQAIESNLLIRVLRKLRILRCGSG